MSIFGVPDLLGIYSIRRIFLISNTLLIAFSCITASANTLHIACPLKVSSPYHQWGQNILSEVQADLGISINLMSYPELRSIAELKQGSIDGICGVSKALYRNRLEEAILIPVVIAKAEIELWSKDKSYFIELSDNPQVLDFNLGYYRGGTIEILLDKYNLSNPIAVASTEQGLKMLAAGRIDAFVATNFNLWASRDMLKLDQLNVEIQKIALGNVDMYFVLHFRHENIAAKFSWYLDKAVQKYGGPIRFKNSY
ncbi:hypothetical protein R50073_41140 [Maricurvus nonylphenolicus]|uniref:hypothetical protein n=1 Tax=Maricurvus nonylphenolicus TaxID=1008307 RepID=UPI0036F416DA